MNKTLPLALSLLLLAALPSAASAATATADIRVRNGVELGPVTFKAAKGERNDVTVTNDGGLLRMHDDNNRVRARGDCTQVNRHTALCPSTEDIAQIRLGNRNDHATVESLVTVFGGDGNDVLRGSSGDDRLDGERGNDTLHGLGRGDDLTGGPGRDRVFGGSGDDDLFDDETDAQAAADLYRGGSSRDTRFQADIGDTIDYSKRKRALDIDLSRSRVNFGPERDVVRGLESIVGGSAGDKLSGDGDDNWIFGKGGNDRIRGRGGDDLVRGDGGNDRASGEDGNDYVSGESGLDQLSGGNGNDQVTSRDSTAETVDCGPGEDVAVATRLDTLVACSIGASNTLNVKAHPTDLQGNRATFEVSCPRDRGCSGTLTLTSLTGESYGAGSFNAIPHGVDRFTPVEVDLTQAGRDALRDGQVIVLTHGTGDGGFRTFMQVT